MKNRHQILVQKYELYLFLWRKSASMVSWQYVDCRLWQRWIGSADKLPLTRLYNGGVWGCCCVQEPSAGMWLIRLRNRSDEGVCEWVSLWHDEALMHWQVESSFSCSSPVIIHSFHSSYLPSLLINSPPAGSSFHIRFPSQFLRYRHASPASWLSLLPATSPPHLLLLLTFSLSCCLLSFAVLCVDIYSNSLTGHSGGRMCEHSSEIRKYIKWKIRVWTGHDIYIKIESLKGRSVTAWLGDYTVDVQWPLCTGYSSQWAFLDLCWTEREENVWKSHL